MSEQLPDIDGEFSFEDLKPIEYALDRWRDNTATNDAERRRRGEALEHAARYLFVHFERLVFELDRVRANWEADQMRLELANAELDKLNAYLAADDEPSIAQLVEWDHHRSHGQLKFEYCPYETCAAAFKELSS